MAGGLPWPSVFLRMFLPSFCFGGKLWFEGRTWPLQVVSVFVYLSWMQHTYLYWLCVSLNACASSWVFQNSLLMGYHMVYVNGVARNSKYADSTYLLCSHVCITVPLDFIYKTQIQKQKHSVSKMATMACQTPSVGPS